MLSYVFLATILLLVVAVRHVNVCNGQQQELWNEWSHASWQAFQQKIWPALLQEVMAKNQRPPSDHQFHGKYASLRQNLDYTYHSNYSIERQALQDGIIDSILGGDTLKTNTRTEKDKQEQDCSRQSRRPWIVFTAGAMGSGKTHTVKHLASLKKFPLHSFVTVDPDDIRRLLPEFSRLHPHLAGEWTRKEAGLLAELLTLVSLQQGRNVLVDGSLRDSKWYKLYFRQLRESFQQLQIGILHISAPRHLVLQRALERSKSTGRVVPRETLEDALVKVPISINLLKHECDYFAELQNSESLKLTTGTWHDFEQAWQCTM